MTPDQIYAEASALLEKQRWAEALPMLEAAINAFPEVPQLRVAAGQSASVAVESFMRTHALQESMRAPLSDVVLQVMQSAPATDATCAETQPSPL